MKLETSFEFDAAHRLVGYKGLCSNLHGHIWKVEIEVTGDINNSDEVGILWDFTNAKKIKKMFDHKTILKGCEENIEIIKALRETCGVDSVFIMINNPTAENLATLILHTIGTENLKFKIRVFESPKSYAEVEDE